nr:Rid family hydrolase [uncultured Halomonas sp.]
MSKQLEKQFHPAAPWARDILSEAVTIKGPGTTVHLSGIGAEGLGEQLEIQHPGDVYAQTKFAYEKAARALSKHDASLADVVKITAYLLDSSAVPEYLRARQEAFGDLPPPAHTLLIILGLAHPDMLVEIDLTAVTDS